MAILSVLCKFNCQYYVDGPKKKLERFLPWPTVISSFFLIRFAVWHGHLMVGILHLEAMTTFSRSGQPLAENALLRIRQNSHSSNSLVKILLPFDTFLAIVHWWLIDSCFFLLKSRLESFKIFYKQTYKIDADLLSFLHLWQIGVLIFQPTSGGREGSFLVSLAIGDPCNWRRHRWQGH